MTDRYAVIGNPIAHSKSPVMHAAFAMQCAQDMHYDKILGPLGSFVETIRNFQYAGGKGINITIPFKQEAFVLADELTDRARAAGAVNTFVFRGDGSILGDNTDGVGLARDITRNLGRSMAGKRILLLGAGGTVRGILLPMIGEKPAEIFIANRTPDKAVELARSFAEKAPNVQLAAGGFSDIKVNGCFDIVINATAASLSGDVPPIPSTAWNSDTLAYDMYYKSEATAFILAARKAGIRLAVDGLGMLVEQGAESFYLWRGVRPDTAPVLASLRG